MKLKRFFYKLINGKKVCLNCKAENGHTGNCGKETSVKKEEDLETMLNMLPPYVVRNGMLLFLYIYKDDCNHWRIRYEYWGQEYGFMIEKKQTLLEAVEATIEYLDQHLDIKRGKIYISKSN